MSTVAYIGPTLSLEILGEPRGERELLEMRILNERQHLVHSERWPVPQKLTRSPVFSVVKPTAIALAVSHRAHTCTVQSSQLRVFTRAWPIQFELDSNHLAKWIGSMRIQSGSVSMRIQCGCNQCASNAHSMSRVDRPLDSLIMLPTVLMQ